MDGRGDGGLIYSASICDIQSWVHSLRLVYLLEMFGVKGRLHPIIS